MQTGEVIKNPSVMPSLTPALTKSSLKLASKEDAERYLLGKAEIGARLSEVSSLFDKHPTNPGEARAQLEKFGFNEKCDLPKDTKILD